MHLLVERTPKCLKKNLSWEHRSGVNPSIASYNATSAYVCSAFWNEKNLFWKTQYLDNYNSGVEDFWFYNYNLQILVTLGP
jgi:hypothetical protein